MLPNRIKYICYYDWPDSGRNRGVVLAATNKLDYIFEALNSIGVGVDIISMSGAANSGFKYFPAVKEKRGNNTLRLFSDFGFKSSRIVAVLLRLLLKLKFAFYILREVSKGEEVIVYHSYGYSRLLTTLQRIKGFKIIGEIEEIYQDVKPMSKSVCKSEYKFFSFCDKYIFPTKLLDEKLNKNGKPHIIINGTYKVEPQETEKYSDGKIHLVYAGTFDSHKGGAATAIEAARYLPENYVLHVCGFGNEKDTILLLQQIEKVKSKSKAEIIYEGLKRGKEYIRLLQKCDIGLSTQNPHAKFNDTSFPSKILSYMANGLQVVTIKIPVIEQSNIGKYMHYYENDTPVNLAEAIMHVFEFDNYPSRRILEELHVDFLNNLTSLLK